MSAKKLHTLSTPEENSGFPISGVFVFKIVSKVFNLSVSLILNWLMYSPTF